MFFNNWEEAKPKPPKYAHKEELFIDEFSEHQAQKYLAEIPQILWVIEKTYGGKNKYILQSDSKEHIYFFLHMFKKYRDDKQQLLSEFKVVNKEYEFDIKMNIVDKYGDVRCSGSIGHIRFKHIDGSWYG